MSKGFIKTLLNITFWTVLLLIVLLLTAVLLLIYAPEVLFGILRGALIGIGSLAVLWLSVSAVIFLVNLGKKNPEKS